MISSGVTALPGVVKGSSSWWQEYPANHRLAHHRLDPVLDRGFELAALPHLLHTSPRHPPLRVVRLLVLSLKAQVRRAEVHGNSLIHQLNWIIVSGVSRPCVLLISVAWVSTSFFLSNLLFYEKKKRKPNLSSSSPYQSSSTSSPYGLSLP